MDDAAIVANQACIALLQQVLDHALAGYVTSVAIVACGRDDFGTSWAGSNAPAMNLGLDVIKKSIVDGSTNQGQPKPKSNILRPRPVGSRN